MGANAVAATDAKIQRGARKFERSVKEEDIEEEDDDDEDDGDDSYGSDTSLDEMADFSDDKPKRKKRPTHRRSSSAFSSMDAGEMRNVDVDDDHQDMMTISGNHLNSSHMIGGRISRFQQASGHRLSLSEEEKDGRQSNDGAKSHEVNNMASFDRRTRNGASTRGTDGRKGISKHQEAVVKGRFEIVRSTEEYETLEIKSEDEGRDDTDASDVGDDEDDDRDDLNNESMTMPHMLESPNMRPSQPMAVSPLPSLLSQRATANDSEFTYSHNHSSSNRTLFMPINQLRAMHSQSYNQINHLFDDYARLINLNASLEQELEKRDAKILQLRQQLAQMHSFNRLRRNRSIYANESSIISTNASHAATIPMLDNQQQQMHQQQIPSQRYRRNRCRRNRCRRSRCRRSRCRRSRCRRSRCRRSRCRRSG